jgi:hypothetical protein
MHLQGVPLLPALPNDAVRRAVMARRARYSRRERFAEELRAKIRHHMVHKHGRDPNALFDRPSTLVQYVSWLLSAVVGSASAVLAARYARATCDQTGTCELPTAVPGALACCATFMLLRRLNERFSLRQLAVAVGAVGFGAFVLVS